MKFRFRFFKSCRRADKAEMLGRAPVQLVKSAPRETEDLVAEVPLDTGSSSRIAGREGEKAAAGASWNIPFYGFHNSRFTTFRS